MAQGSPPSNSTAAADRAERETCADMSGPLWPALGGGGGGRERGEGSVCAQTINIHVYIYIIYYYILYIGTCIYSVRVQSKGRQYVQSRHVVLERKH